MHLSMVCPRGGGSRATQGKFDIFRFSNEMSNSQSLGHHYKSNFQPWATQIVFLVDTTVYSTKLLKNNTDVSNGKLTIIIKSTTCHCLLRSGTGFWVDLYVTPGIGHIYSAFIQLLFSTEIQN